MIRQVVSVTVEVDDDDAGCISDSRSRERIRHVVSVTGEVEDDKTGCISDSRSRG